MTQKLSMFLVDDREDNLFVLESVIRAHLPEIDILTAGSGEEALCLVKDHPVNIAVIDVQMPGIDGIELCRRLKADPATSHVSVLLVTSHHATSKLKAEGLEAGAEDFVNRPFDNTEFAARLKVLLRLQESEEGLRQANRQLQGELVEGSETLQQRELQLQQVIDLMPFLINVRDAEGQVLLANKATSIISKKSPEEMVGKRLTEVCPNPEDAEAMLREDREVLQSNRMLQVEDNPYRNSDGKQVWLKVTKVPFATPLGEKPAVLAIAEDVTEKRRQQQFKELEHRVLSLMSEPKELSAALGEVLAEIKQVLDIEGLGVRLQDKDADPFYQTLGLPQTFVAEVQNLLVEGEGDVGCLCEQLLRDETPLAAEFFSASGNFWSNQAQQFFVDFYRRSQLPLEKSHCHRAGFETIGLFTLQSKGKKIGLLQLADQRPGRLTEEAVDCLEKLAATIAIAVDREFSFQAEKRARQLSDEISRANLEYLQSNSLQQMAERIVNSSVQLTGSSYGLLIDIRDGVRRLLAASSNAWQDMAAMPASQELKRELDSEGFACLAMDNNLLLAPLQTGQPVLSNNPQQHPGWEGKIPAGHPQIESFLGMPLRIGDETIGLLAVINRDSGYTAREQDILQLFANAASLSLKSALADDSRRQAEEQLFKNQKFEAIGQLAGGIAHDYNNLLTIILGYGDMVRRQLPAASPELEDMEMVIDAGHRAEGLTRQLLAYGRRQVLAPQVLLLDQVALEFEKLLRRLLRENIRFDILIQHSDVQVLVDPAQVEQLLMNLLVNARDAIGTEQGEISLTISQGSLPAEQLSKHPAAEGQEFGVLQVTDSGCGMRPEVLEKVFEPFFTTKKLGEGTGLGLSTVYGIVKQSGGYLFAKSQPGKGSTFTLCLPLAAPQSDLAPVVAQPLPAVCGTATILLVDDDVQVRSVTEKILAAAGHQVLSADSAASALALWAERSAEIDLLVTDYGMPEMNGLQLADRVLAEKPTLRVLLVSGYADVQSEGQHPLLQESTFLNKPFTSEKLLLQVQQLLSAGD